MANPEKTEDPDERELSLKELAAVVAYTNFGAKTWGNKTASVIEAGYDTVAPRQLAYEVFKRPRVREAIQERMQAHCASADEALAVLREQLYASLGDFVQSGRVDFNEAEKDGKMHLAKSYQEAGEKTGARVEIVDSAAAADKILRATGAYKDNLNVSGRVAVGFDLSDLSDDELDDRLQDAQGGKT